MPAEASSSCPSDAKREATNANARYGVDDPFDRERPPPIERPHKRDVVERRFKGRARARATITRRDALSRERQKSLRLFDDSKEEETFARSMMMMMMISTRSRFIYAPTTSLFGAFFRSRMAVATSLILSRFFFSSREAAAFSGALSPSSLPPASPPEDAMSLSLSLVDEDGFDGRKKSEEEKKQLRSKRLFFESRNTFYYHLQ